MAARHGFIYHHARGGEAVLCKWLVRDEESKVPLFSNHTVGVAGKDYVVSSRQTTFFGRRFTVLQS